MISDVREGDGMAVFTRDGLEITRSWIVTAAETAGAGASTRLQAAFIPAIPALKTPHPDFANLLLVERSIRLVTQEARHALVTGIYRGGSPMIVSIHAALEADETTLALGPEENFTEPIFTTDAGENQGHQVEVHRPRTVMTVQKEYVSPIADVLMSYVGKVNSLAWPAGHPDPPRTWLCTGVEIAGLEDLTDGSVYVARLEFRHNPETWRKVITHEAEGEPVSDPIIGQSQITADIYPQVDFAPLAISV